MDIIEYFTYSLKVTPQTLNFGNSETKRCKVLLKSERDSTNNLF